MIVLKRKQDCCGCTACMNVCPHGCISMQEDKEGFLYPSIDESKCTGCNACNMVCPVIMGGDGKSIDGEHKAFAAFCADAKILAESSSGGAFTAMSYDVIDNGGTIFGAAWVNGEVRHIAADSYEGLACIRGSKYVQSSLDFSYKQVRELLRDGVRVLFSGTPCQIAGLKSFLRKKYDNLATIEVACHGVPSPKVLRAYMQELREKYGDDDVQLNFRSKPEGWKSYKVAAYSLKRNYFFEGQKENVFMKGFLRELYSRPICHECPFKAGKSGSDISIADFWGIDAVLPDFPSYGGVSLVITHSDIGRTILENARELNIREVDLAEALKYNRALVSSERFHPERAYFFRKLGKIPYSILVERCLSIRQITRIRLITLSYIRKIIGMLFTGLYSSDKSLD